MPRIFINEIDNTSPGVPPSYSNYSVLITGFTGRTLLTTAYVEEYNKNEPDKSKHLSADKIQPDANGVYEFTTSQDFKNTIGQRLPLVSSNDFKEDDAEEPEIKLYHYGNQMAYELLELGYSIIYRPLTKFEEVADSTTGMCSDDFWAIFKDKSNYDFRFVTHGLLDSYSNIKPENYELQKRLNEVNRAIEELNTITANVNKGKAADKQVELAMAYDELDKSKLPGLIDIETDEIYTSFGDAVAGTEKERAYLESLNLMKEPEGTVTCDVINEINKKIADLATYDADQKDDPNIILGRGDCTALIELCAQTYVNDSGKKPEELIIEAINGLSDSIKLSESNGRYCALTVPYVYYTKRDIFYAPSKPVNQPKVDYKFPGAFHYLACFMNSLKQGFAEWYAAAGYTRGIASYTIDHTPVKLGEIAINALEPRYTEDIPDKTYPRFACNVIANFRGSYYLWGNRTAHPLGDKYSLTSGDLTASSFLNIRQLCSTIKKQLYVSCRRFTFDPNSDTLWFNFVNAIKPTLEAMKADQGIRDYRIVKVYTDKKATLKAKIRIIPIEAVEDFDLTIYLEDSFGETVATVGEAV